MASWQAKIDAAVQRFVPSTRTWTNVGDFVTFTESGFVDAESPSALLARHNYEIAEVRGSLTGRYLRSLEIGCGFGRLSPHFAAASSSHIPIDINFAALRMARSSYPQYSVARASATELPFADSSFDLVTTWTVLQHIRPDRILGAMAEIERVAAEGATLLLCEESAQASLSQPDKWHTHTWHRRPEFYRDQLPNFELITAGEIEGLAQIGMPSPGTVMLLRRRPAPAPRLSLSEME